MDEGAGGGKQMADSVRYVTNEQGERVGVLLDVELYKRLVISSSLDPEDLPGLNRDELEALANCKLALADQKRLDELISKNTDAQLLSDEVAQLDRLLAQADHLTILKTRARYTLWCLDGSVEAS